MNWCPGLGTVLANEEVTADGPLRAGQLPGLQAQPEAVDDADHRVRRPAAGRPGHAGLAGADQADAAQLDRPLHRRAHRLPDRRRRRSGSSPPGRTPSSAPPTWCWRPSTSWSTRWSPAAWPEGTRPAWTGGHATPARGGRRVPEVRRRPRPTWSGRPTRKEKTGVFIGAYATNPVNGAQIPIFIADYVLAGYGTGAIMAVPGAGRAGLGVRRGLRPADHPHRAAAGGLRRQGVHRATARRSTAPARARPEPGRPGRRRGQGEDHRVAGGERARPAARSPTGCGTGCSAGSGTGASRSRSSTTRPACRSRCPSRCCRSSCPRWTTSRRRRSTRTTPTVDAGDAAVARARTGSRSSWTWATGRSGTPARPT